MLRKMKLRIYDLMESVSEMLNVLPQLNNKGEAISDCLAAINAIVNQLEQENPRPEHSTAMLKSIKNSLLEFANEQSTINEKTTLDLIEQITSLRYTFKMEVKEKLNVVFFPYKASMWDSFGTVYEAAIADENCIARVVPIPYYQLTQDEVIPTYEGDRFPSNLTITHYNDYQLEIEQPDIIFVHNIYDNYNTITQVHERYFTANLKQYTDMLVYIPYHVSSFIPPTSSGQSLSYSTPSIANVDKVILVGEYLKEAAIRDEIPEEKLLALGSPKLDAIIKVMNENINFPPKWEEKIKGKTVYLVNTGCLYFANQPFLKLEKLVDFFNISRFVENSIVIWRPHPLTEISIKKYTPHFLDYYRTLTEKYIKGEDILYKNIIFDETDDYLPALKAADVLISSESSILRSFLLTEKKVLFWDEKLPDHSLLPSNVFYYVFDKSEPWYELVKKFSKGFDPLAENRKNIASKVYSNTDGTAGEKVYHTIKNLVLNQESNW